MANRLDKKLAKRRSEVQSVKLGIKGRWYYVLIDLNSIQIIVEDTPLEEIADKIFDAPHEIYKMGAQSIYLISEPRQVDMMPTAIYSGNNLYGSICIVAMANEKDKQSVDALPFNSAITAIDALWFSHNPNRKIEIVL